ncbi:hypothetical protein E308F_16860 [Moorella sp. E308F]|uniref:hypothetical protein n=1 Tax=unclassified Neomoorella TaxID=2676739 RepID=UPI0010FFC1C1|nr:MULTISPECIES: hypothetical protein [unclassified Moorella (in: firmicutes)]GEA15442.1 hypothetical protein E308F_16860 [Moorella sp. E308F]GEA19700.1 hypothetical protein E306M_28380 [Moorella sp. E306M]
MSKILRFLRSDRGEAVPWMVVLIIGVIMAVTVWKYIGPGLKTAAQKMGNSLAGQ